MSAIGPAFAPSPVRARRTLLSSCAVASALAVMGQTSPASGQTVPTPQGYNGTIQASGTVNYDPGSSGNGLNAPVINLTSRDTILTWTPSLAPVAGTINFQSEGATTTFVGPQGRLDSNFSVLNRVMPTLPTPTSTPASITFNGTTNALGTVLFYSPGGIIVSPTARFDVGRLMLSTNAISGFSEDGYGSGLAGFARSTADNSPADATINIQAGANATRGLFASGSGANYVALVAPRIIQNGNVAATQTAYLAADAGTLTTDINVNSGLFSIGITAGTSAADALTHGGVTALTGGDGTLSRAFMVAVPRNNAITLLLAGAVTYADQVNVEDGAIILSTGGVETNGAGLIRPTAVNSASGTGTGFINVETGNFTSIYAASNSGASIGPRLDNQQLTVTGDFELSAQVTSLGTGTNGRIAINGLTSGERGGNLRLRPRDGALSRANLFVDPGATLAVAGDLDVDMSSGVSSGRAGLDVTGGTLTVGGNLTLRALAGAGSVNGGTVSLSVTDGAVDVGAAGEGLGALLLSADGASDGGTGPGGFASLVVNGALGPDAPSIRIGGNSTVSARGVGSNGGSATASVGATLATGAGSLVSTNGGLTITADATGGILGNGAGNATLDLIGGSLSLGNVSARQPLVVSAASTGNAGASGFSGAPAAGGTGDGGVARITVGTATLSDTDPLTPDVLVGGSLSVGTLALTATGTGGAGGVFSGGSGYGPFAGGRGGDGIGGRAILLLNSGVNSATGGITVDARGFGGVGGSSNNGPVGAGGRGLGGSETSSIFRNTETGLRGAYVSLDGGATLSTPDLALNASAIGGASGYGAGASSVLVAGGSGEGGTAALSLSGGSTLVATGNVVTLDAGGTGGAADGSFSQSVGTGGTGLGGGHGTVPGGARVTVDASTLTTTSLSLAANATGGASNLRGGDALGGATDLTFSNGATIPSAIALTLNASAIGGTTFSGFVSDGSVIAPAGSATGGEATLTLSGMGIASAPFTLTNAITLDARGIGVIGGGDASLFARGGDGTGGVTTLTVDNGANVALTGGVTLSSGGTGGEGYTADGGTGTGGSATVIVTGAAARLASLTLDVSGTGGESNAGDTDLTTQNGGTGTGGTATIGLTAANGVLPALTVIGDTGLNASGRGGGARESGYGGEGGYGDPALGLGGSGGGGQAIVTVASGTATLAALRLDAGADGGESTSGGATGTATGRTASITVGQAGTSGATLSTTSITLESGARGGERSTGYGGFAGGDGGSAIGGSATLSITNGIVANSGATNILANAVGGDGGTDAAITTSANGGNASGGTAAVTIVGGTLGTNGLILGTSATAGAGASGSGGGAGAGGTAIAGGARDGTGALLTTGLGASISIDGVSDGVRRGDGLVPVTGSGVQLAANAIGGAGGTGANPEAGAAGGAAQAGAVSFSTANLTAAEPTDPAQNRYILGLVAQATGGAGGGSATYSGATLPLGGAGGNATGGTIALANSGSALRLESLALDSTAIGGAGAAEVRGGDAFGGAAGITLDTGSLSLRDPRGGGAGPISITTTATGGTGGGSATAGGVTVTGINGATIDGTLAITASAIGTDGIGGHYGTAGGDGGSATAGGVTVDMTGGALTALTIAANAQAGRGGDAVESGYGTAGGAGGDAGGGVIAIGASGTGTLSLASLGATRAAGQGGAGSSGAVGATGADGTDGSQPNQPDGTDGQAGGVGQAGGAGGRGGNATGATLSLTAGPGGTITLPGTNGLTTIDLGATAADGGLGAQGGDGGAGGAGGRGARFEETPQGPLPAGVDGAPGAQGAGGAGGNGGAGGTATGGSLALAASGGTLDIGNLTVITSATGGGGNFGGNGGSGPSGGASGNFGENGLGEAGSVSLFTSDVNGDPASFGRIIGGDLSVTGYGAYGNFGGFFDGGAGRFVVDAAGSYLSPDRDPLGSIALNSITVQSAGGFSSVQPTIDIVSRGQGRISVAGDVDISTSQSASLRVQDGGQIRVGRRLGVFASQSIDTSATGSSEGQANLIAATAVDFFTGSLYSYAPIVATRNGDDAGSISATSTGFLDVTDLTATDSIAVTAGTIGTSAFPTAYIGNLRTTAPVDLTASDPSQTGGRISVVVGQDFTPALVPNVALADANLEITGTLEASNTVSLTAGGDIRLNGATGATILSNNLVRIDAGDNVTIESGATVRAALDPLADPVGGTGPRDIDGPAGLIITGGVQQVSVGPAPGDVASIIVGGTLTSGRVDGDVLTTDPAQRRGILLTGQAVQTEGGTIGGRSLTVEVNGASPTSALNDDNGALTNGCYGGDACLGTVDVTNALAVGGPASDGLPTNVRVAAGTNGTVSTVIRAQNDVTLGTDGADTIFGASSQLQVQALGGTLRLLGGTVLSGISATPFQVQIAGAAGIEGAGATIRSSGAAGFYTNGRGLSLRTIEAARLDTLNDDLTTAATNALNAPGRVTIGGSLAVSNGDIFVNDAGPIYIEDAAVADGFSIGLTGLSVTLNGVRTTSLTAGAPYGTATDISLTSTGGPLVNAAVILANASAARDIRVSSGAEVILDNVTAGDDIFANGASASVNRATTTGSFGETGYGSDGSRISVLTSGNITSTSTISAFDGLELISSGGSVSATDVVAGDDARISGATLALGSVRTTGTSTESGYGQTADGSNIVLIATAAGTDAIPSILIDTANAFDDLTITASDPTGSVSATTLIAGRDIAVISGASILGDLGGSAGRDFSLTSTNGAIDVGALSAPGTITLTAATSANLGQGDAGGAISISAGGTASAGALSAGTDITVLGADVAVGSAVLPGSFASGSGTILLTASNGVTLGTGTGVSRFLSGGSLVVTAQDGGIALLDGTTLGGNSAADGGPVSLIAGSGIDGGGATVQTAGVAGFYTGTGGLSLDTVRAASLSTLDVEGLPTDSNGLTTDGAISINTLALAQGDANLTSGADLSVGEVQVASGRAIALNGATGATLGLAGADPLNAPLDVIVISGGATTVGTVTAQRDIALSGTTSVSATSLNAGDDIDIDGGTVSIGSAATTGAFTESGYGADGSNIRVTAAGAIDISGTANAFDTLVIRSTQGAVTAATLSAGNDALVSGDTIRIGSVTSRGTSAEAGYGVTPDGSNIALTATGPITITGTADAAGDLGITSSTGAVATGTLAAGDDIAANGTQLTIASATSRGAAEAGYGDTPDGSNIMLTATGPIAITGTADAAGDLAIASSAGAVTAGALAAGDDVRVSGTQIAIGSATSRGTAEAGYGATPDGSNITLTATGPITITGTADAAGDLDITSSAGPVVANILTAGDDVTVSGTQLTITSATGRGTSAEAGYGATSDGSNVTLTATAAGGAGAPALRVTTAGAARDLRLNATAAGGAVDAGTLTAGDDIFVDGPAVSIGSATSTGAFAESGYGADGSNISVSASGPVAITGTANAFDDLTIMSGGGVTANILTAGDDARVTAGGMAITSVTSRGTGVESGYGSTPDGSNIVLAATGAGTPTLPAILVTRADAANDLTLSAASATGTIAATTLIAGRDIAGTAGSAIGVTSGTAGRDLALTSSGGTLGATSLLAGRNIALAALGNVTLGDATANGAVALSGTAGDPVPTNGLVTISAGRTGTTGSYAAADIAIGGTVRAAGHVQATAGRDILVGGAARIQSDNRVTLRAGDDILVASGAQVTAALDPLPATTQTVNGATVIVSPAALVLDAGSLALGYTPAAGNVASLIVAGSLGAAARPVSLTGGAIQADASTLTAGSLTASVLAAPAAGAAQSNDGGQLRAGCLQGDICLGGVTLTGFTAGTTAVPGSLLIGQSATPTNVRIAGAVNVGAIDIRALNGITLGTAGATLAQTSAGAVSLDAAAGSVSLLGALTLTGGAATGPSFGGRSVSIAAGNAVDGAGATIVSRGPLAIGAGSSVTLAATRSAEATRIEATTGDIRLNSLATTTIENSGDGPGSGVALTAGGTIAAIDGSGVAIDAVGDVYARAGGDARFGTIVARRGADGTADTGGSDIDIAANGDVSLVNGTAADDATLAAGGALTIANGLSGNSIGLTAGGPISFGAITAGSDAAIRSTGSTITGDRINAGGTISLAAAGAVRIATDIAGSTITATGTDIALNALGNLTIATVDATAGNVLLASNGGAITVDRATATQAVTLASGTGADAPSNAARAVTVDTIEAGTDATVLAQGPIAIGLATAGRSIIVSSADGVALTTGNAGFDVRLTGIGAVSADTLEAGHDAIIASGTATLGQVTAGNSINARTSGGALSAGTLRATTDILLAAATNLAFTTATATNGSITATSGGDLSFGSATAGGSVTLAATGALGTIDDGSITAGDSISATTGLDLVLGDFRAANNLTLGAGGLLRIANAGADAGTLRLTAGGTLSVTGNANAGSAAILTAGGAINLATATAGTTLTATSNGGAFTGGTLRSGDDMALTAGGDLTLADAATTSGSILLSGADIRVGSARAAGSFSADASGLIAITAQQLAAGRAILLNAGTGITAGDLLANASIMARSGGAFRIGNAESVGGSFAVTSAGTADLGNVRAAGSIFVTAGGAVTSGDLTAGTGPLLAGEGMSSGGVGGTDAAPGGIALGFDGVTVAACDDSCGIPAAMLGFVANYFGTEYGSTFVSNNGYFTFNTAQTTYTPDGLAENYRGQPIVAAFFADVDTRNPASGRTTYGQGTFAGREAFGATYRNVGYFSSKADKTNTFQIILTNRADTGAGNFDIYYNYGDIAWETGDVSGGTNGFGGFSAAVGYNAGTGNQPGTFYELPGSLVPGSFLNGGPAQLVTATNNGTPGQLVFMVRNGGVVPGGTTERPSIHVSTAASAAPADIRLGNLSAEAVEVHGSGAVTTGDVSVGDRGSGIATSGQPYATVLDAATNLTTGNIMSTGLVALSAGTGDLFGGSVTTASSAVALVGGAVQLGTVSTGRGAGDSLFVTGSSTSLDGFDFDTLLTGTTFDPAILATATPTRIGGALTLAGPASAGNVRLAAAGLTMLDAIDAANGILIDSGGNLNATTLAAGGDIVARTDGDLAFTSADAGGSVTLAAGGGISPIDGGAIDAGDSISVSTGRDLAVGNLAAANNLTLNSGGALRAGALTANAGTLTLTAANAITLAGAASAGTDVRATAGGAFQAGAVTASRGAIALTAGDALTLTGAASAGTDATLTAARALQADSVTAGSGAIALTAGTALTLTGPASAGTDARMTAGGALQAGSVTANGAIALTAGTALTLTGAVSAGTDAALRANGSLQAGAVSAARGALTATAGNALALAGAASAGADALLTAGGSLRATAVTATNGALTATAGTTLALTGAASAGTDATLTAGGDATVAGVTAGNRIALQSTGGSVTATDLLATNGITAQALGNLFVRDAVVNAANGNVRLASGVPAGGTGTTPFLLAGNTSISGTVSANTVTIQGGGDVTLAGTASIRSDGTILIASGDDVVADAGSTIGLGQIVRPIGGGQSQRQAGGPADVVTISAGALRQGTANLAANGASGIVMNGSVDGLAIALNSEAIDIGAGGRVGSALTTAAVFTNTGTGGTTIGGAGDAAGYAISNAALGRARAQAIRVVAPGDATVQQLALTGSAATNGNLAGNAASFEIASGGTASVTGAVTLASAGQNDLFSITANNRITVLTPGGSIALNGAGGDLGGRIRLAAPRIAVGNQATLAALDTLASLDARDERLADNGGTASEAGFLQANGLEFRVGNALYIQNSGTSRVSDTRRGFTVGSGGVTIVTTGTGPAEVAINGRQTGTGGTFITGRTLIERLTLSGTGQATMASLDPRSTANGCLIAGMSCRFDGTAPSQPIQDIINTIINAEGDLTGGISSVVQQLNSPLIELIDFTPFRLAGIIDEPVTGAGNDDYYTGFAGDDAFLTGSTLDEQVTGTGADLTTTSEETAPGVNTDEQVTGTGRDQTTTDEQVTGTGRDQTSEQVTGTGRDQTTTEQPDGKCDAGRKENDPDCK